VALLVAAELAVGHNLEARAGLDECAQAVATARRMIADVVDRAGRDRRSVQRQVALLELDLATADLARAHARLCRLRRRGANP